MLQNKVRFEALVVEHVESAAQWIRRPHWWWWWWGGAQHIQHSNKVEKGFGRRPREWVAGVIAKGG
jgi:hypothetical protein